MRPYCWRAGPDARRAVSEWGAMVEMKSLISSTSCSCLSVREQVAGDSLRCEQRGPCDPDFDFGAGPFAAV